MTNEIFAALLNMFDKIHPMFSSFFHCLGQEFYKLNFCQSPITTTDIKGYESVLSNFPFVVSNSW